MFFRKYLYKIAYPFARTYWRLFKPKTQGVKCIVEHKGNLLLVRNTYTRVNEWTFPGGGVRKAESLKEAVAREVFEETGVAVINLMKLGELTTTHQYKVDTIHCFYGTTEVPVLKVDQNEIEEARWFSKDALPITLSHSAKVLLERFLK